MRSCADAHLCAMRRRLRARKGSAAASQRSWRPRCRFAPRPPASRSLKPQGFLPPVRRELARSAKDHTAFLGALPASPVPAATTPGNRCHGACRSERRIACMAVTGKSRRTFRCPITGLDRSVSPRPKSKRSKTPPNNQLQRGRIQLPHENHTEYERLVTRHCLV
jgi:hypothetical protein